jgi:hypothetical protein
MRLKTILYSPLEEPLPPEWDQFVEGVGAPAPWCAESLTSLASASSDRLLVGLTWSEAKCVAAFCCRIERLLWRPSTYVDAFQQSIQPSFVQCVLPTTLLPGLIFGSAVPPADRPEIISSFLRALYLRTLPQTVLVVFRGIDTSLVDVFARCTWCLTFRASPDIYLDNRWKTFEQYVAAFPSKKRNFIRSVLDQNHEGGDIQLLAAQPTVDPMQACELVYQTQGKHRSYWQWRAPFPIRYFQMLNERTDVVFFGYKDRAGRLLIFDVVLVDDRNRTLYTTLVGNGGDETVRRRRLYFDLYLREIQYMISNGFKRIYFGPGHYEAKRKFGTLLERRNLVVVPRLPRLGFGQNQDGDA